MTENNQVTFTDDEVADLFMEVTQSCPISLVGLAWYRVLCRRCDRERDAKGCWKMWLRHRKEEAKCQS